MDRRLIAMSQANATIVAAKMIAWSEERRLLIYLHRSKQPVEALSVLPASIISTIDFISDNVLLYHKQASLAETQCLRYWTFRILAVAF